MKKRIFALLVAVLLCWSTAITIGAEESTTYRLASDGTVIAVPTESILDSINVSAMYVAGANQYKWVIPIRDGAEIKRQEADTTGQIVSVIGKLVATGAVDDTYTYFEIINVDTTATITVTQSQMDRYTVNKRFILSQILIPVGTEPEVTDSDTPSYDDINQSTQTIIQFWTNMVNSIYGWIAHPTYAIFDTQSPVFSVLALVFACGVTLTIIDKIFDFWRK